MGRDWSVPCQAGADVPGFERLSAAEIEGGEGGGGGVGIKKKRREEDDVREDEKRRKKLQGGIESENEKDGHGEAERRSREEKDGVK